MIHYNDKNKTFHLQNDQISYVMKVDEYGVLSHCYFGSRLPRYSNYLSYPVIHRDFEVDFVDQNQKEISYRNFQDIIMAIIVTRL